MKKRVAESMLSLRKVFVAGKDTDIRTVMAGIAIRTGLVVAVFLLVFAGISLVSYANEMGKREAENDRRETMESCFISECRTYLKKEGFLYAGVNLTKVTNDKGIYEYNLLLCHEGFDSLSDDEEFMIRRDLEKKMKEKDLGKISIRFN